MGFYDTALICLNGHVITDSYRQSPQHGQKFCGECGLATIHACQACGVDIRGDYHASGVVVIGGTMTSAPSYCHECGKPYPWTVTRIEVAKAMAEEVEGLTTDQRLTLKVSIEEIAGNTPRAELAVLRVKKVIREVPKAAGDAIRKFVVDVASETAAKALRGE